MTSVPTKPLADCAKLLSGGTPRKANADLWAGDVPWLTPKDMARWTGSTEETVAPAAVGYGTKLAPPNASFVAVRGMSLHSEIRVVRSEHPLTFNQDVKAVVAATGTDPVFLYYVLVAGKPQLLEWVSSAGHGTGVLETSRLLSLPVPDIGVVEQRRLAEIFGDLDDKIELNRRMNETLEAMAQAIFRDWFVDFGPVRRKMEGATDPVAIMGGLTPDPARAAELAMLFPSALGANGLPEGWVEGQLGDLVASVNERRKADERTREQPYVPIDCLPAHSLALEDFRPGEEAQTSLIGFMQDDILFGAMRPYFHKVVLAPFEGTTRTTVFVLRPKAPSDLAFAALLASAPSTIEFATANSSGTTIPYAVWGGSMERMPVTLPPTNVRASFQILLQPTLEKMKLSLAENRTLAETRDYLLPRLMSGQVRVGDPARKIEAMSA